MIRKDHWGENLLRNVFYWMTCYSECTSLSSSASGQRQRRATSHCIRQRLAGRNNPEKRRKKRETIKTPLQLNWKFVNSYCREIRKISIIADITPLIFEPKQSMLHGERGEMKKAKGHRMNSSGDRINSKNMNCWCLEHEENVARPHTAITTNFWQFFLSVGAKVGKYMRQVKVFICWTERQSKDETFWVMIT